MRHRKILADFMIYMENRVYIVPSKAVGQTNSNTVSIKHNYDVDYTVIRKIYNGVYGFDTSEGVKCVVFPEHYEKAFTRLLGEVESTRDKLIFERQGYLSNKEKGVLSPEASRTARHVVSDYNEKIKEMRNYCTLILYLSSLRYDSEY